MAVRRCFLVGGSVSKGPSCTLAGAPFSGLVADERLLEAILGIKVIDITILPKYIADLLRYSYSQNICSATLRYPEYRYSEYRYMQVRLYKLAAAFSFDLTTSRQPVEDKAGSQGVQDPAVHYPWY